MGKKSSKSSNVPWKAAQPYILGGADAVQGAYNQNAPGIQQATDSITGLMPGMIDKYKAGDAGVNAARGYNVDVLGGKYLDQGNPYLQQMIDQSGNDVRNQTQAAMGVRGLTGGSDYAGLIADRVSKNSLGMRYQDYAGERDRMATASGQSPGLAAADTIQINPLMQALNASMAPMQAAGSYASSLGGLLGGYQTQKSRPSTAQSVTEGIGTALQLASLFSDARLKTDVSRVGQTDGGLPIYTFRYGGEGPYFMGPMAQEVAEAQPDALGPEIDGYMTVRYEDLH